MTTNATPKTIDQLLEEGRATAKAKLAALQSRPKAYEVQADLRRDRAAYEEGLITPADLDAFWEDIREREDYITESFD